VSAHGLTRHPAGAVAPRGGGALQAGLVVTVALSALAAAATNFYPMAVLAVIAASTVFAAAHRAILRWRNLVGVIILVVLLIPIRRYHVSGSLPFDLEPYRVLVGLVAIAWSGSLLVEPATRLRPTGLERPLLAVAATILLSVAVNLGRISHIGLTSEVVKKLTFLASFFCVMYLIASVVVSRKDIDALIKLLVGGAAFVAATAIVESRTNFNMFDHLQQVIPFLHFDPTNTGLVTDLRGGRMRAYASAQHSVALGGALVMLLPLAGYIALRTGRARWWAAVALIGGGTLATVSRTPMLMAVIEVLVLVWLKPAPMKRLWPLALPFLVAVHVAIPGTLGAVKSAFFPTGGIVKEQKSGAGTYGSGRLADLGPGIREWSHRPIVGQGNGTRISDRADPKVNAPILDDEWLGRLLETGVLGVLALGWLFGRAIRRFAAAAKSDATDRGWLKAAIAAAVAGYAAGMATYDSFSFIQVTLLLFILLGLGASELALRRSEPGPLGEAH
jgi:hypothetical protein